MTRIAMRQVSVDRSRKLLVFAMAVVFADTMFFTALTPLLPHFADRLGLDKTGAGVLAASYPAGVLLGAIPSGMVAARAGVKRTVLVGLTFVAICTVLFGVSTAAWEIDLARFVQGLASAFSWTGALAWLVAATPSERRGTTIGTAFAAATGGALFGPVLGSVASVGGVGWTFGAVGAASLALAVWAASIPKARPETPQPVSALLRAARDGRLRAGVWLMALPALLFGTLGVLAPLRLSHLGFGPVAIGATFLIGAAAEVVANLGVGRAADRHGLLRPLYPALAASAVVAALLPWPGSRFALAVVVVFGALAFGMLFTPATTLLSNASEHVGLDYGYTFAVVNLSWAVAQAAGAAGGGALGHAAGDRVPYLILAAACALTLGAVWRLRGSISSTTRSAPVSSDSSAATTGAA
jgi:predicted MFS family arabinose efflux permease